MDFQSRLKLRRKVDFVEVWDPVRKRYVVLSPEELVRQLIIQYFIHSDKAKLNRLSVERKIMVHGKMRRYDLLIHNKTGNPIALIECKAPEIRLNKKALLQIGAYNLTLGVSYLIVTNGPETYCMCRPEGSLEFEFQTEIPDFGAE